MKVSDAFLARGLVPVMNHRNDTYAMIEDEGRPLVNGLLRRRSAIVFLAITRSSKPNAVTFRQDDVFLMALTDTPLRRLEMAIIGYLEDSGIAEFLFAISGVGYRRGDSWPTAMTWGINPDSRRAQITTDARYALFYEVFDSAWTFALLHECSHIENGDLDLSGVGNVASPAAEAHERRSQKFEGDLYRRAQETIDLMFYGGDGINTGKRFAEVNADRNAACWLMQLLVKKYISEPTMQSGKPDPFALLHLALGAFGAMAAVLLIAHHEVEDETTMPMIDHPGFDVRIAGIGEGIEAHLTSSDSNLDPGQAITIMRVIAELRAPIETVVLGAPSDYTVLV